jgi:hypothetical protein
MAQSWVLHYSVAKKRCLAPFAALVPFWCLFGAFLVPGTFWGFGAFLVPGTFWGFGAFLVPGTFCGFGAFLVPGTAIAYPTECTGCFSDWTG